MGLFAGGVLFGTAGIQILTSQDAKKVYAHVTAAVLRAKDCGMETVTPALNRELEDKLVGSVMNRAFTKLFLPLPVRKTPGSYAYAGTVVEEGDCVISVEKVSSGGRHDRIVMMTGNNVRTARMVAAAVGVDDFHAEVLPEDKAAFVRQRKADGHTVIMVGDGVNDTPALLHHMSTLGISLKRMTNLLPEGETE